MTKSFDDLLAKVAECPMKKVAVACAQDDAVLEAVKAAKDRNIAEENRALQMLSWLVMKQRFVQLPVF